MTTSRLAIAAIILIAAAIPSFAQTKSADVSARTVHAAPGSGLELAFHRTPVSTADFRTIEPTDSVKRAPVTLTAAMFTSAPFDYVGQKTFTPQFTIYDTNQIDSKVQFSTDSDGAMTPSKHRVTFVPSKGQKIPN